MFGSDVGGGVGYWNVGPDFPDQVPMVGEWYDVEVDPADEVLAWTRVPAGDVTGFAPVDGGGVAVSGVLERVEPGASLVVMRLGLGLMSIDVACGGEELAVGDVIRFETPWIEVWPYLP
ncbi:hypothetical protein [Embleya sp. NPDC059237]|uniref:hypothetical protein n=1 Tax=Embleya sp. NPDC059237 TaxID=3346784 RepID=UPI00369DB1F8